MTMFINSPGGSISAGNDLIQAMEASGKTFNCVVHTAISMAFVTTQLGCTNRYVLPNATLMQHQARYGLQGQPARHQRSMVDMLEKLISNIEKRQADRLGMTLKQFVDLTAYDWWMDAEDAIKNKAADEQRNAVWSPDFASTVGGNMLSIFSGVTPPALPTPSPAPTPSPTTPTPPGKK